VPANSHELLTNLQSKQMSSCDYHMRPLQ